MKAEPLKGKMDEGWILRKLKFHNTTIDEAMKNMKVSEITIDPKGLKATEEIARQDVASAVEFLKKENSKMIDNIKKNCWNVDALSYLNSAYYEFNKLIDKAFEDVTGAKK